MYWLASHTEEKTKAGNAYAHLKLYINQTLATRLKMIWHTVYILYSICRFTSHDTVCVWETALAHFNVGVKRAHLPLSPVILYSVWFFFSPSVSRSHPVPAGERRGARSDSLGWMGGLDSIWIGRVGLHRLWPKFISILLLSLQAVSDASAACIILACANANEPQKLERIYADTRGYRWVQIRLVIVSDLGFLWKVSCKRIKPLHIHSFLHQKTCSHGNCMHACSI